jgi:nucleotide-binding universal stress UspA family protein
MATSLDINRILFPTDFSETAEKAQNLALSIAQKTNAKLTILHVFESSSYKAMSLDKAEGKDVTMDMVQEWLQEKADGLSNNHNVLIDVVLGTGRAYDQIVSVSQDIEADLIVMGTHGVSGFAEFFAGSNAFRVVTQSPCPVLTMQETRNDIGFKNIVMPIDSTSETRQKVPVAAYLAELFGATIHIASLITDDSPEVHHKFSIISKQIAEYLEEREIAYTENTLTGDNLASMTMNHAESKNADLIIMMTEQESNLTGFLVGPYAQQIVNHSKIPVLSISPEETDGFHFG